MEAKKIFHRNSLVYSRMKQSDHLAGYCISQDARILYYQILRIVNGKLIFNDDRRIMTLSIFHYQWQIMTRKYENQKPKEMEPKINIDLQRLCAAIERICPQNNKAEFTGEGMNLNGTLVTVTGTIAVYKENRCRVTNIFELVRVLQGDKILKCTKEDLYHLSTTPSKHSHTL